MHFHRVFVYFSPTLVFTKLNYAAFCWLAHYISANLIMVYLILILLKFNDGIENILLVNCAHSRQNERVLHLKISLYAN